MIGMMSSITCPLLAGVSFPASGLDVRQQETVEDLVAKAISLDLPIAQTLGDYTEGAYHRSGVAGVKVAPNFCYYADWDIPVGTNKLSTCSALLIHDPQMRRHWLGHVMPLSGPKYIVDELVPGKVSKVFVMPGEMASDRHGAHQSLHNIFSALVFLEMADAVNLVVSSGGAPFPGLITLNGKLYDHSIDLPRAANTLIRRGYLSNEWKE